MSKKLAIFKVRGEEVEQIEGDQIDIQGIEGIKACLAIKHHVPYNDIEVDIKDVYEPELSTSAVVNEIGLYFRANRPCAIFVKANGIGAIPDINTEVGFEMFLDAISKRQYDKVITFN